MIDDDLYALEELLDRFEEVDSVEEVVFLDLIFLRQTFMDIVVGLEIISKQRWDISALP